jgi:hypothetical protein
MVIRPPMSGQTILSGLLALGLAALFTAAIWLRVTSLKTAPIPMGDEAIYPVIAGRLLQGRSVSMWTPTGHLFSPILVAMQIPFVWAFEPSYTAMRLPVALCGILTVVLTFVLGSRVLDRTTAGIAAGLLAVLPIAIIFSRIEWEPGLIPLWSLVALYLAFRAKRLALLAVFLIGAFLVHPTTILLAPALFCVLAVQLLRDPERSWTERWRAVLLAGATGAAVVLPIALSHSRSGSARLMREVMHFGPCDWPKYLTLFKNLFMGHCMGGMGVISPWPGRLFWGVVGSLLVAGTWTLARQGRWERLALVGSVVLSAAGLHMLEGPEILLPGLARYGIFLLVPFVLALACLASSLVVAPATPGLALVRKLQFATFLVIGFGLLLCTKHNWFDVFTFHSRDRERFLTLPAETLDPNERMAKIILKDLGSWGAVDTEAGAAGRNKHLIVTEDFWRWRTIEFFTLWRKDIQVLGLDFEIPVNRERILRRGLETGAYVVSGGNPGIESLVLAWFPRESLRHWHVQAGRHPINAIYRLRRRGEPVMGRCFCNWPIAGSESGLRR